ncbi:Strongly-conserved Zn-finger binding protein (TFIIIA) [Ascosphaera atra]|nr:Strongly-conserved Zn-finger binding protein (TFIIIA) [Ascosphaera atra]
MAAHEVRDKYKCTGYADCDETFRKHSTLQRHIKSVHLGQKPFPCDRDGCTAGFETAGHLRVHIARMHGEPRFTCTECENARENETPVDGSVGPAATSFPTYAQLQTHIRNAHPPVCTECGQSCASARDLRRHTELLHGAGSQAAGTETVEGDKPKDCHICPFPACARAFSKKGNLNVHIRTVHEGEKRFVCGETDLSQSRKVEGFDNALGCGKRYGSKLALEEHVRVAHLGLKNAKAERRERLSNLQQTKYESASDLTAEAMENNPDLTRLTGDDISNPEKRSSRNIPCLLSACMCRFYRDYDLWLHMTAYHAMGEAEVQMFFMQRAMTGGYESFDVGEGFQFSGADDFGVPQDNTGVPGIQGNADMSFDFLNMDLSLDTTTATFPSTEAFTAPVAATNSKDMASFLEQTPDQVAELDMTLVDPSLSYNFDN